MKKVRAAIVGYGNIGHFVLEALQAAPDFEIAGVVRRAGAENRPAELSEYSVVKDIKELKDVDVAILCTPTRSVEKYAKEILALGIHPVYGAMPECRYEYRSCPLYGCQVPISL